jgi:hypothetical protein
MATQTLEGFDRLLVESIDEAMRELFSQQVVDALHHNLKTKHSLEEKNIAANLGTVCAVLEHHFGTSAHTIETVIAMRLYSKLGLKFERRKDRRLAGYVYDAKIKIRPPAHHFVR